MINKISTASKIILVLSSACIILSLFVPIWRIELDAPQYPEGLMLQIHANAIAGDVDIINGLNHYIGMKTLRTEDFIEFTILPYILISYALLFLVTAFVGKRKLLYFIFGAFVLFGIVAMADFWQWEYNYGHDLDPKAAIKVPGMAYQPPLVGFKQLLNFGAYSIPDKGGWLIVAAGLMLLISVIIEYKKHKTHTLQQKMKIPTTILALSLFLAGCNSGQVEPIKLNKDGCDFCRMTISDGKFGAEIITPKGRVYKYDDLQCLLAFANENPSEVKAIYVNDHSKDNELIDATTAFFVHHKEVRSPMLGNIAAFSTQQDAEAYASKLNTTVRSWQSISQQASSHEHGHEH